MGTKPRRLGYECVNIGSNYTDEEREFLIAIDRYKRMHQRPYPTWAEILDVIKGLGYHRDDVDSEGRTHYGRTD